jgi:hypothetical protein
MKTENSQLHQFNYVRYLLVSFSVILFLSASAKVMSAFGHVRILDTNDPVFSITFRHMFWCLALLELTVSLVCIQRNLALLASGFVAWLSTCFLVYRFGLIWVAYHKPCPCLGNLTDALHISPEIGDMAMKITLGYLLVGSYGCLIWLWLQKRMALRGPVVEQTSGAPGGDSQ